MAGCWQSTRRGELLVVAGMLIRSPVNSPAHPADYRTDEEGEEGKEGKKGKKGRGGLHGSP